MNKNLIFKKLFVFIFCIVAMLSFTKVNAVGDVAYFTKSTVFQNRNGANSIILWYNSGSGILELGSSNKEATLDGQKIAAYCFNHEMDAPPVTAGANVLYKRELKACEKPKVYNFAYVLENGYGGNWSLGDNFSPDEQYYITQLAVWFVQGSACDGIDINTVNSVAVNKTGRKAVILNAATTLYNNAMAVKAPATGSLSITPQSSAMKASADKKYYRTDDYTVSGSGFGKYTVKVVNIPSGSKIVDSATNKEYDSGATIENGHKFYIKVPIEKVTSSGAINPKITITTGATYKELAIFESKNQAVKYQNIGVAYGQTTPLTATASATLNPTGELLISKKEKTETGEIKDLKDVTIKVTSTSNEKLSWTWNTTNENPKKIGPIPTGQYRIEEISAPEGIIKAETRIVTVKPLEITTVELVNFRTEKVTISKQDATTGAELEGAHIQLQDVNGNVLEEWDSKTTPHVIEYDLTKYPEYCLVETIAPKGYQKKTTKQCFKVNSKGGVDTPVIMKNEPETGIKISKVDAADGKELPGAKLIIKKKDTGETVHSWVSTSTPHYVSLEPGKYTLIEVQQPKGYELSESFIDFEVTKDGVEQTLVMKNSRIPDTADIPVVYVAVGLCAAILIAGFGMFKLSKQES